MFCSVENVLYLCSEQKLKPFIMLDKNQAILYVVNAKLYCNINEYTLSSQMSLIHSINRSDDSKLYHKQELDESIKLVEMCG